MTGELGNDRTRDGSGGDGDTSAFDDDGPRNRIYEILTDPILFAAAIERCSSVKADHPDYSNAQMAIAGFYSMRFKISGDPHDANGGLLHCKQAVEGAVKGHPDLPEWQHDLAVLYGNRYNRLQRIEDLEEAMRLDKLAISAMPPGHLALPSMHQSLAVSYHDRYRRYQNLEDLNAKIYWNRVAVDSATLDHPSLLSWQRSLAVAYNNRYQLLQKQEDIDAAVHWHKIAVDSMTYGHPDLPGQHYSLGVSYNDRYRKLRDVQDLEAAIRFKKLAIDGTPDEHVHLPARQQSLAVSYFYYYQRFRNLDDLEMAITLDKAALDGTPSGHPELSDRQQGLATSYRFRYERLRNLEDLEAALHLSQLAVGDFNHPNLHEIQQSLAEVYSSHYERLRNVKDLEAALEWSKKAVDGTPSGHPDLPRRQQFLAIQYGYHGQKYQDMDNLEAVIKFTKLALDNTPPNHQDLPGRQQSLAMAYSGRYRRNRDIKDLQEAHILYSMALDSTPPTHLDFPGYQQSLAISFKDRYRRLLDLEDLNAALALDHKAVGNTPHDHPDLPGRHYDLATSYMYCYERLKNPMDLEAALDYASKSMISETASPTKLWNIAISTADWIAPLSPEQSFHSYSIAFKILPDLLWIGSSLLERHTSIIDHKLSEITSMAVTTAIEVDQQKVAIEFFEQGLSVTHRQIFQLRDKHSDLSAKFPQRAEKLITLSLQLAYTDIGTGSNSARNLKEPINYNLVANERQNLIKEIRRTLPGFESFLLPPSYLELSTVAKNGPVIMLNCGSEASDALIILSPTLPVKSVHLPGVSNKNAAEQLDVLRMALKACRISSRDTHTSFHGRPAIRQPDTEYSTPDGLFKALLSWLWEFIVQPIFDTLKECGVTNGRIWWCPSGYFTYLPIHAAAPLDTPYIQSFTLTLDALIQAQKKQETLTSRSYSAITAIGVSDYPDQPHMALPMVKREIEEVETTCYNFNPQFVIKKLLNTEAKVDDVLQYIKTATWIHLACHGQQDPTDPLKSSLVLSDGNLELKQIIDANIQTNDTKFIFLSACETAMGDRELANEAMHLAGGFIAAGFQGAIGTLWSMDDPDGPQVAKIVYKQIFKQNGSVDKDQMKIKAPNITFAAEGLHNAIQKLRRDGAPFERWIPYIHLGI